MQLRISGKDLKKLIICYFFRVQTLGAGVAQDQKILLEQISRQKIVKQIGFRGFRTVI